MLALAMAKRQRNCLKSANDIQDLWSSNALFSDFFARLMSSKIGIHV